MDGTSSYAKRWQLWFFSIRGDGPKQKGTCASSLRASLSVGMWPVVWRDSAGEQWLTLFTPRLRSSCVFFLSATSSYFSDSLTEGWCKADINPRERNMNCQVEWVSSRCDGSKWGREWYHGTFKKGIWICIWGNSIEKCSFTTLHVWPICDSYYSIVYMALMLSK